jgi:hypothetical protein
MSLLPIDLAAISSVSTDRSYVKKPPYPHLSKVVVDLERDRSTIQPRLELVASLHCDQFLDR